MEEYADEIFNKLDNGAHMYFCGLKVHALLHYKPYNNILHRRSQLMLLS
jgi:hypothetical protein